MSRVEALIRQLELLCRLENTPQGICPVAEEEHDSAAYKRLRRDLEVLEGAYIPLHREQREGREWVWLDEGYRRHKLAPLSDLEVLGLRWVAGSNKAPVPGLEEALRGTLQKLDAALAPQTRAFAKALDDAFVSDRFGRPRAADPELLRRLGQACGEQRVVELTYRDAKGRVTERDVEPYNIWSHRGAAYLVGWCRLRHSLRTFSVGRIRRAELSDERFEPRDGYTFDRFVEQRFRIMDEGQPERVRIRFACEASLYIAERTWHPSQTIEDDEGGAVVLAMTVDGLIEVASWVLSFGPRAQVLEPPRLIEMVRGQLEGALVAYRGEGGEK
jgi:predicted DNA-binding transcriptional regulator YafY